MNRFLIVLLSAFLLLSLVQMFAAVFWSTQAISGSTLFAFVATTVITSCHVAISNFAAQRLAWGLLLLLTLPVISFLVFSYFDTSLFDQDSQGLLSIKLDRVVNIFADNGQSRGLIPVVVWAQILSLAPFASFLALRLMQYPHEYRQYETQTVDIEKQSNWFSRLKTPSIELWAVSQAILLLLEGLLILVALANAVVWWINPDTEKEPAILLATVLVLTLDYVRRQLRFVRSKRIDES